MNEVLDPSEVGVALGRDTILPADVVVLAEPVGIVEGRIGEDVVGSKIWMKVAAKSIGVLRAEIRFDATQSEVHDRQPARGRVALLAIDADVAELATVGLDEFFRLNKHSTRAAAWIIDATFVRTEHFDEAPHDTGGRVELTTVLALGAGEASQKVLVDAAE